MRGRDIRIKTTRAPNVAYVHDPKHCSIDYRNLQTLQGALLRGDEKATLYGLKKVPEKWWDLLRRADNIIGQEEVFPFTGFPNRGGNQDASGELAQLARYHIENKRWSGMKFMFKRVLAKGGHGYVSLWDVVFDDKSVKRVVIKRGLNSTFNPKNEAAFHLRYDGAEHTTQVIDLDRAAKKVHEKMKANGSYSTANVTKGITWNAEQQNCVVFEYLHYGDVVGIMQKVVTSRAQFTDQVLWGIWECCKSFGLNH
ncbi:hypothetical protein IL306_000404 [Fusarium sp. DS 682]|nr:hypothetical protein IL306_000404 [Fusarium sp. DS 682]